MLHVTKKNDILPKPKHLVESLPLLILSDGYFTLKKNDIMESDRFYSKSICMFNGVKEKGYAF
jgi:hypothetical protein